MIRSFVEFWAAPSNSLVFLIVLGLVFSLFRRRSLAFTMIGLGALGLVTFGYTAANELLMAPLVKRFPSLAIESAPEPDGIVLVGSGIQEVYAHRMGALLDLAEDGDGIPIVALLADRFPQARIIVSSGSGGSSTPAPLRPADGIRRVLIAFGVSEDRIMIETRARNTFQRASYTVDLIGDDIDKTWWVVTSAHRMPRVIGAFRKSGIDPVPYPVDFQWIPPIDPFYTYRIPKGLELTDAAVKEWLALFVYWYTERIPTLFPAPGPLGAPAD